MVFVCWNKLVWNFVCRNNLVQNFVFWNKLVRNFVCWNKLVQKILVVGWAGLENINLGKQKLHELCINCTQNYATKCIESGLPAVCVTKCCTVRWTKWQISNKVSMILPLITAPPWFHHQISGIFFQFPKLFWSKLKRFGVFGPK